MAMDFTIPLQLRSLEHLVDKDFPTMKDLREYVLNEVVSAGQSYAARHSDRRR